MTRMISTGALLAVTVFGCGPSANDVPEQRPPDADPRISLTAPLDEKPTAVESAKPKLKDRLNEAELPRGEDDWETCWREGDKVAETIERELGGFATSCDRLNPRACVYVEFRENKVTDTQLERLGRLPRIGSLSIDGAQITDIGLGHLKGLTQLQHLILNHTKVTDAGLAYLQAMKQLRVLSLEDCMITDTGLKYISLSAHLV